MPTTYFTSDLHFSHKNIMKFCPQFRSYASIKEMDAALIAQWNATVAPEDTVYNLGDISLARDAASIARVRIALVSIAFNCIARCPPRHH